MNLSIMWDAVPKLLAGVPVTLQLVSLALLFGFVLAGRLYVAWTALPHGTP